MSLTRDLHMIQWCFLNGVSCINSVRCHGQSITLWPSEDISEITWNKVVWELPPPSQPKGGLQPLLRAFSLRLVLCSGPSCVLGWRWVSCCEVEAEPTLKRGTTSSSSAPSSKLRHRASQGTGTSASRCPWVGHLLSPNFSFSLGNTQRVGFLGICKFFL